MNIRRRNLYQIVVLNVKDYQVLIEVIFVYYEREFKNCGWGTTVIMYDGVNDLG